MMTTTQRVTITERENGFHVRSGKGMFGIHIRVQMRQSAVRIKQLLKAEMATEARQNAIDAVIRFDAESRITPSELPRVSAELLARREREVRESRLHLVWSR
jgi:hypothetical protein